MSNFLNTAFGAWIKAAGVRALKTFFQVFASLITVDGLTTGLSDVDWIHIASVAAVSFVYSLATSLAGLPELQSSSNSGDTGE